MMRLIQKLLRAEPRPVTYLDVPPAPRDPETEAAIKNVQADLVQTQMRNERRSWEIRQALANNALNLVIGAQHDTYNFPQ